MEYTLDIVDRNQKVLNTQRPLTGNMLDSVKDYYRISLTYTSNAIEGNTLTESETKVILEDGLTVGGHSLREMYEATGHAKAYDFMWSLAKSKMFSVEDIKQLHQIFYRQIDPEKAGQYRNEDVIITGSFYPVTPWQEIPLEMSKFMDWCDEAVHDLHPVIYAAEMHRRFVYHPSIY